MRYAIASFPLHNSLCALISAIALLVYSVSQAIQDVDILRLNKFNFPENLEDMTNREQLIQELEQASDDVVQTVLDFLHRVKTIRKKHPLAEFAGILSDSEAEELKRTIATECRQVDLNEWVDTY